MTIQGNLQPALDEGAVERPRVRILPDGRMTRADAALYLGVSEKTMAQWQTREQGPTPVKVGGRVFYFMRDLDAFISGGKAA